MFRDICILKAKGHLVSMIVNSPTTCCQVVLVFEKKFFSFKKKLLLVKNHVTCSSMYVRKKGLRMDTNEKGRSMVEMIAVIAVMAVLSLGGIAGYTLAINRFKADRLLDVAGKLAGMGVGGTTYRNLKAAGLEVEEPNVEMSLDRNGFVCVTGLSGDVLDAFEAQSIPFKAGTCAGNGIRLNFNRQVD